MDGQALSAQSEGAADNLWLAQRENKMKDRREYKSGTYNQRKYYKGCLAIFGDDVSEV